MYGLPESTVVNGIIPKKNIVYKFGLIGKDKTRFESSIHRITISHEISARTVNLIAGDISGFFILRVELYNELYDKGLVTSLFEFIPQNMVIVLECGPRCRPVVFQEVFVEGQWSLRDDFSLRIEGINLDHVWQNMIVQVGNIIIDEGNDLQTQIRVDDEWKRREAEIAKLEKKLALEKQPRKKKEIFDRIRELKSL